VLRVGRGVVGIGRLVGVQPKVVQGRIQSRACLFLAARRYFRVHTLGA
jgi:hypothetical protein